MTEKKPKKFECFDCEDKCPECGSEEARVTKNYTYCKKCKTRWTN
jgi:Pyruvate/2-oxoacid:ferredoxin oxidoreductase delta subunit